LFKLFNF